jgi:hypothetical protein
MNDAKFLADFLQSILVQLPVLIVALIGIIIVISRWNDAPAAGVWSLLGFGSAVLLCLLYPISQAGLRYWSVNNPGHSREMLAVFTGLGVVWSLVRAASYTFLLAAIFAGRTKSA